MEQRDTDGDGNPGALATPSERVQRRPRLAFLVALLVPALLAAGVLTVFASFSLCGISGCSGGGFGRATSPSTTLGLLAAAGICAALPVAGYAVWLKSLKVVLIAGLVAIVVAAAAGWLIGADLRGCPRNVDTAVCIEEST